MLTSAPVPGAWRDWLAANVHHYAWLRADEQVRLQKSVQVIVAEKDWVGCGGLSMSDEVKVTIAGQAAVMLLGVDDYYFDRVLTVLVYPDAYTRRQDAPEEDTGIVDEEDEVIFGEAWHRGPIVLSWADVRKAGRRTQAGRNLVIHEFAHHLDGLDGWVDGVPPLATGDERRRWKEVTEMEYRRLVHSARHGRATLLDQYGASNRAEFFAVASECFFEQSASLRRRHPDLYEVLMSFYRQDPAARQAPADQPAGP
jgi:Mlc titration factor MtfA (ptsG expression regulator)